MVRCARHTARADRSEHRGIARCRRSARRDAAPRATGALARDAANSHPLRVRATARLRRSQGAAASAVSADVEALKAEEEEAEPAEMVD